MKPLIILNLKTYKKSSSDRATKLIKKINSIKSKRIIITSQTPDLVQLKKISKHLIYAQHVDPFTPGRNTGFIIIEELKSQKIKGSLLNHSEHRIPKKTIKQTLKHAKEKNFKIILCVQSLKETKKYLKFKPNMIALELPELISSSKSITEYKSPLVKNFSSLIKKFNKKKKTNIIPLCGAGISNKEDVQEAINLGCSGVLLSSAFVNSRDPEKFIRSLIIK